MSNSWWEIKILCEPKLEESIYWRLEKFGCSGTATEIKGRSYLTYLIRAYIPEQEVKVLDLAALALWLRQDALLIGSSEPIIRWDLIDEEDWSSSWKQYWQPQPIGDLFLIYPAWLEPPSQPERMILRIDPGMAFGTGVHATTQLCLESLEMRIDKPDKSIIVDIGSGSGILSIGAILLGAQKVYAVDIDPLAVTASENNRQLNDITSDQMVVAQGSVEKLQEILEEGVDGIICNILLDAIMNLVPQLTGITKARTWAVFSGILLGQLQPLVDLLEEHGWVIATVWKRQEWCCLNVRRGA